MNGAIIFGKPAQIGESTNKGARDKRNDDRMAAFVGPSSTSASGGADGAGRQVQYLVVADGVTSTHGGGQASEIVVQRLQQVLQASSERSLPDRIADAIQQANQAIVDAAGENPDLKGMSTTLVIAAIEGEKAYFMHLGDSRAYLLRGDKAYQLTLDHTWIQEALDEGRVTPEQAANHPNRHLIQRYLGAPRTMSIDPRIIEPGTEASAAERRAMDALPLQPGDGLLLCSDGLYGRVSSTEMAAVVAAHRGKVQQAADALVELALKRDEPDNITALLWSTAAASAAAGGKRRGALLLGVALALLAFAAILPFLMRQPGTPGDTEVLAAAPAGGTAASSTGINPTPQEADAVASASTEAPTAEPAQQTTAAGAAAAPTAATEASTAGATPAETQTPTAIAPTSTAVASPVPTTSLVSALVTATQPVTSESAAAATADAIAGDGAETIAGIVDGTIQENTAGATVAASPTTRPGTRPTSTPLPTATALPTATPTPTRTATPISTATAANGPTSGAAVVTANTTSASGGGPRSVVLLDPPENTNTNSPTVFAWKPDVPIADGQVYEVAFWKPGETAESGQSWTASGTSTSQLINPGGRTGSYRWGVWLGRFNAAGKYERIRFLGGDRKFDVSGNGNSSGNGGNSSGGGGSSPKPGGGD
ncbi:MAG: protein phosphatase 2C domain-containing protein [Caldilineaceae bacterium]